MSCHLSCTLQSELLASHIHLCRYILLGAHVVQYWSDPLAEGAYFFTLAFLTSSLFYIVGVISESSEELAESYTRHFMQGTGRHGGIEMSRRLQGWPSTGACADALTYQPFS